MLATTLASRIQQALIELPDFCQGRLADSELSLTDEFDTSNLEPGSTL